MSDAMLGVDPGLTGGAVLVRGSRAPVEVLGAWYWRPSVAGWRVTDWAGLEWQSPALHDVAVMIAGACDALTDGWRSCVEGLFVPRQRGPHGVLALAEATGELLGPLRGLECVARPLASEWRPRVLGRCPRGAAAAEAYAVRCAPKIGSSLGVLQARGHVAEALCIAYYGAIVAGRGTMCPG